MKEIDNPFKKSGRILLVIGILDIGLMAYCIANKISYSSSFNIFAVVMGILLMRGGVKTARIVRWFSGFFVIAFIGMLFLLPIIMPLQLLTTQVKLNPVGTLGSFTFAVIFIGVLIWVYLQLSAPSALTKIEQAGYNTGSPKSALYTALCIIVLSGVIFGFLFNSETSVKAKALAEEQFGTNYKYHIRSISIHGNSGSAVVTAYNSNEIKNVQVRW